MDDSLPHPPAGLRLAERRPADTAAIADADRRARHWQSTLPGPLRPGTETHRRAVTRMFRETFNPYKPSIIDWPNLDAEALARLRRLPIWDIAVQTEGRARIRMLSYARSVADPAWRGALELNAWEEGRHKHVLANLVRAYGIALAPEPPYPAPRAKLWAYLVTGFSECVDSFFAFGLFALAERSGYFPPALVETFEPVMQEECRHILLFANWLAWYRATLPWWRRPGFELTVAAVWLFLAWERVGLARGIEGGASEDANFAVTGSQAMSDQAVTLPALLALCLEENDRRFAHYDRRLKRPAFMPWVARTVLRATGRAARAHGAGDDARLGRTMKRGGAR